MLGSLPAFDELYKMTGNKLPGLLDTRDTETVEVEESQDTPDQPQEN
jgi:hypothetical protein